LFPTTVGLVVALFLGLGLFRLGRPSLFAATAGGLGIAAGLVLAVSTEWGFAPTLACALCGFGAAFLSGTVLQFRSVVAETSIASTEDEAIAHRALSRLFSSLLTNLAILAAATIVISLIALNFDLGHLNVAGLTLLSVAAIIATTVLALSMRSGPEKNVK
jgi:hypothetical protein